MVCRSFSSFLFKAQPPAKRGQTTLSRRHSQQQSCYESNNTKVIHNNTFIQFCKENATQKMSKTFISESFHIFCQSKRSTIWMVPLSFERCWFIWTFSFSQFSDVRLSDGYIKRTEERQRWRKTQIDLENWWSPALVPRHTNINYPLLINAIRPTVIVDSCRRCWPRLYTVHVPLTVCLWGLRDSI